jgi:hypothetical protein
LFKLALQEIYGYVNSFIQLSQNDFEPKNKPDDTKTIEESSEDDVLQKKFYLLLQIQKLLNELTQKSSSALSGLNSRVNREKMSSSSANLKANEKLSLKQQQLETNSDGEIDPLSVTKFRNETIICSDCYGDLFVI